MPTGILDSFQIVVALYLFYIAFKGSGQMYRFGDMDEETQQQIRTPLRLLYAAGGLIALIEFGLCCLQNSMFIRTADETGVTIVQNYSIDALPFLSYDLLSVLSAVLTALLVGLLVRTSRSLRMYPSVPYWQVTSYHPFTSPLTVTMVPALMVARLALSVLASART